MQCDNMSEVESKIVTNIYEIAFEFLGKFQLILLLIEITNTKINIKYQNIINN